jgi:glutathione S-transferase
MIHFYCGSGSPYAWRVWLALEHKALPYDLHMLSFAAGDLKSEAYRNVNPRGKIPAITDGDFALAESAAIVEYLDDAYPHSGSPLFPASPRTRAVVRRMIREADEYFSHALEGLVDQLLFPPESGPDATAIDTSRDRLHAEMGWFEGIADAPFLAGSAGAADFTLYPMIALALRIESRKQPDLGVRAAIGPRLSAWMQRVEALPFFDRTYPPHWRSAA